MVFIFILKTKSPTKCISFLQMWRSKEGKCAFNKRTKYKAQWNTFSPDFFISFSDWKEMEAILQIRKDAKPCHQAEGNVEFLCKICFTHQRFILQKKNMGQSFIRKKAKPREVWQITRLFLIFFVKPSLKQWPKVTGL